MRSTSENLANVIPGDETVITGGQGSLARIRLNRAKALNDFEAAGLADIHVPSDRLAELVDALVPLAASASKIQISNVTLRLLRLGRQTTTLEDCLEREFAATHAVLESHDFYEGVRAAVIDKDRNPQWRPAVLPTSRWIRSPPISRHRIKSYLQLDHGRRCT
jgi:enoyl-CoA hydratase/carnithine racemase